jgi:hypothetical protein
MFMVGHSSVKVMATLSQMADALWRKVSVLRVLSETNIK